MYKVVWRQSALAELATLWTDGDATMREAISATTVKIDSLLAKMPNEVGESRPNNQRIAFVPPLAFRFQVRSAENGVVVIRVWAPRRKR